MKHATVSAIAMICAATALASCDKNADAAPTVDKAAISTTIKKDVADLVQSFNNKNIEKAVTHDAPDVVSMIHGAPNAVGPEEDLKQTKKIAVDPLAWITTGNETVEVSNAGDMAVYRTSYVLRTTDPKTKKAVNEHGNWVIGYKKQANDSWKIAWNVASDTPSEAPAAEPAKK